MLKGIKLRLTPEGWAMLKCAFAGFDFGIDPGKGVVDSFGGLTIMQKDSMTTSQQFEEGKDTYILFLPVPGYAYFIGVANIGSLPTSYVGVPYPNYVANYGANATNNNFTAYRYVAKNMGLYSMSNFMNFGGSISVWRADINFQDLLESGSFVVGAGTDTVRKIGNATDDIMALVADDPTAVFPVTSGSDTVEVVGTTGTPTTVTGKLVKDLTTVNVITGTGVTENDAIVTRVVQGMESIQPLAPRENYTQSFNKGAYTFAFDRDDFQWQKFCVADAFISTVSGTEIVAAEDKPLMGLGNLNTVVFKVTTPTGANNSAVIRVGDCMEFKPNTNSNVYQYATLSPKEDKGALEAYRDYCYQAPVAVPSAMNASAWRNALSFFVNVLHVAGEYVPGPIGGAASMGASFLRQFQRLVL